MRFDKHILEQVHQDHLLFLLEGAFDKAVQAKVSTYYPAGSLLALLPSNADLEKARAAVIDEARRTDFANLVPNESSLRPYFEQKAALHWSFLTEAIANIAAQATEIGSVLLDGAAPTRILALKGDGADAHNGSRHTMVVETDAGTFLYKPRSLKSDLVTKSLCDDLFPGMFCIPQAIDCGSFGFSEFVENVGPTSNEELEGYFEALGTFCALAHFLSLSDQHTENFLAKGARLAPIDLETVLASAFMGAGRTCDTTSPANAGAQRNDSAGFSQDMRLSITATGMLTCRQGNLYGAILAGTRHTIEPISTYREPLDYQHQIITGFEQGYLTCLDNKQRIRTAILDLKSTHLRVLLESTMFYHLLLKRLFDATTWSAAEGVKAVKRSLHSTARTPLAEAILTSEAEHLLRGDYPAFYFIPESKGLYDDRGAVETNYLSEDPLSVALEHLDSLDERDLQFQRGVLETYISALPLMRAEKPIPLEPSPEPLLRDAALIEAAQILAQTYEDILPGKQSPGGLLSSRYGETHKEPMGYGLATGYAGVGVFAAACVAAQAGEATHAKAVLDICVHELSWYLTTLLNHPIQLTRRGLGLADGIGGIARALQLIWNYTADERVPSIYEALLRLVDTADLATEKGNNIYNGLAGLLLSLATNIPGLPRCATIERIADTLLARASVDSNEHRIWMEQDGIGGEVGYGKGTGGIGLAFLRAWQATGEERFWNACCNAIAYEDASYDAELGFWPLKIQTGKKKLSPPGICRGVPGQAIVFTQAVQAKVPLAQRNVERALPCALALPPEPTDNLCCGTSAIVEGLLTLDCRDQAGKLLYSQVSRKNLLGYYVSEHTKRAPYFNPTLFYGCLGVGYELLRYAEPEIIPSIFACQEKETGTGRNVGSVHRT